MTSMKETVDETKLNNFPKEIVRLLLKKTIQKVGHLY